MLIQRFPDCESSTFLANPKKYSKLGFFIIIRKKKKIVAFTIYREVGFLVTINNLLLENFAAIYNFKSIIFRKKKLCSFTSVCGRKKFDICA